MPLVRVVGEPLHGQVQIRAVEAGDHLAVLAQAQPLPDVTLTHFCRLPIPLSGNNSMDAARGEARGELLMRTARAPVGEDRLAKGLGWFSRSVDGSQLLAPQHVNRLMENTARHRVAVAAGVGVAVLAVIASVKTSRSSQLTAIFRGLAGLRHARAFHPRGLMLAGELTTEEKSPLPLDAGVRPVIARLSKGVGTPGGLPTSSDSPCAFRPKTDFPGHGISRCPVREAGP
jgi:hypothetical protein